MLKIKFKNESIKLSIDLDNESEHVVSSTIDLISRLSLGVSSTALDKEVSCRKEIENEIFSTQDERLDDGILEGDKYLNRDKVKITYGVIDEEFIKSHPSLEFVSYDDYVFKLLQDESSLEDNFESTYETYYDTGIKEDEDGKLRFKTRYFCYKCGNKGFHYIPEETETVSCHTCAASLIVFPVTSTWLVRNDMGYYFVAGSSNMNISDSLKTPHSIQFLF